MLCAQTSFIYVKLYLDVKIKIKFVFVQISNSVESWQKISWKKFSEKCQSKSLQMQMYETEADFGETSPEIHDYYHGVIRRHSLVLNLYVCVYSGYPHPCPYIKLSMSDSSHKNLNSSQDSFVRVSFVILLCISGFALLIFKFRFASLFFYKKIVLYHIVSI